MLILALVGAGCLFYCVHRHNEELAASESLKNELITLRSTQMKLEKDVAHLELLPPIADADWEQVLTDQISQAARDAGVQILRLTYSTLVDERDPRLGLIEVNLDVKGNDWGQARCLELLEQGVVGMRFETIEGMMGGGDPYYLSILGGAGRGSGSADTMKVAGRVYRTMGGSS